MTSEHLVADSLWWDGRLHTGVALRLADRVLVPAGDIPADAPRRHLTGTLLPGLLDAHVHSALVDLGAVRAAGISAVWDLGGVPAQVRALAEGVSDPALPHIRYVGPFLIAPGGYPSDRAWAPPGSWRDIASADDAASAVGEAHAAGATLIKVTAHAGGPMLPDPTLRALVAAAHGRDLPVVVHAEGPGTVASAYQAGADLLAHTPWTEPLDDALVRAAAARMTWISTLDIHGYGEQTPARETAVANLRLFRRYGGKIRYGTDLGNGPLPPGVNAREIRALQRAGLTPDEVLAAMTDPAAEPGWIPGGLDLEPDRFADVLATTRVLSAE